MPSMPRTSDRAKEIAYGIMGVPVNLENTFKLKRKKSLSDNNKKAKEAEQKSDAQDYYQHGAY